MSSRGTDKAAPSPRRYLSLWLPHLTADRWRLEHADKAAADRCLVFIDRSTGNSRIGAACAHACRAGLVVGMALADARARVPDLVAVAHDTVLDRTFLEELAETATAFTPSVAIEAPDGLVLDITGCVHLSGDEAALAARLRRMLGGRGISHCRLAVAATPDMARALARFGGRDDVFAHDAVDVRALPVAALECSLEDTTALRRAGLKTVGAVADRPSVLFAARFGQNFMGQVARVLGEEDRRITPRRPLAPLVFDHNCAEPLISLDAIETVVANLAARASATLEERNQGGRAFYALFFRSDGAVRRISVETSRPLRDVDMILRLYRDRLTALDDPLDPGFGFDLIRFEVSHTQDSMAQQTSLDARTAHDDQLAALQDRLTAMFGRLRVLKFQLQETHDPDRAQILRPVRDGGEAIFSRHTLDGVPQRPVTLFSTPHPIEAISQEDAVVPCQFRWRRKIHNIARAHGPERIAPEWWLSPNDFGTRDYFRVETVEGQRFWIFKSQVTAPAARSAWFLHGMFA